MARLHIAAVTKYLRHVRSRSRSSSVLLVDAILTGCGANRPLPKSTDRTPHAFGKKQLSSFSIAGYTAARAGAAALENLYSSGVIAQPLITPCCSATSQNSSVVLA